MKSIIATAILTVAFLTAPGLLPRQNAQPVQIVSENVTVVSKTSAYPVKLSTPAQS
jgi:hypothetical protein